MTTSKYAQAALTVLQEIGGGPISSKTLIAMIVEKGLLEDRPYLYHNVLRKVRESELFDTSKRGYVSLAAPAEMVPMVAEAPEEPIEEVVPVMAPKAMEAGGDEPL